MNLYVLDTDILTLYRRGYPLVRQRMHSIDPLDDLALTVMTIDEELSGWYRLLRQAKQPRQLTYAYQRLAETVESYSGFRILPFPETAIQRYDQLAALKLQVGKMDLRIAAITLENGGILVTRNVRDFQRIPGLTLENWAV